MKRTIQLVTTVRIYFSTIRSLMWTVTNSIGRQRRERKRRKKDREVEEKEGWNDRVAQGRRELLGGKTRVPVSEFRVSLVLLVLT